MAIAASATTHPLVSYYLGEIHLSEDEIQELIIETLDQLPDDYAVSCAYYLRANRFQKKNKRFEAYEAYDLAYMYLNRSSNDDSYLGAAILSNQGTILKRGGLVGEAVKKYETALPLAYDYSISYGLRIQFNLGWTLELVDQERALEIFLEILNKAEKEQLLDRQAKTLNEVGNMLVISGAFEEAIEYFEKALSLGASIQVDARTFHNFSEVYGHLNRFEEQEKMLRQSLELRKGKRRFTSLRDLGKCYLDQGRMDEALEVLMEAQSFYQSQPLTIENIKMYEWLAQAQPESDYWKTYASELERFVMEKQKLEDLLRKEAMQNLLTRLETEREREEMLFLYRKWGVIILSLIGFSIILWYLRGLKIKRAVESEINEL